jgi:hypothetical protein
MEEEGNNFELKISAFEGASTLSKTIKTLRKTADLLSDLNTQWPFRWLDCGAHCNWHNCT